MKKQNQVPNKKGRTTKNRRQQKPPTLPRGKPCVSTGDLDWDIAEYEEAEREGRFVTVELTEMQDLQSKQFEHFGLKEFLAIALNSQLTALNGTTPLTITAYFRQPPAGATLRRPKILALCGPGPGGVDPPWMKRLRAQISRELRRRGSNVDRRTER
jgi:hypothetical protein